MNDERVIGGSALRRIDFFRRFRVGCVAAESLHGFGREHDQSAVAQDIRRAPQIAFLPCGVAYNNDLSFQVFSF